MGRAASVALALTLVTCTGATQPSPSPRPTPTGSAAATAATSPSATGPWTFTVDASSKTTVRVREVLASIRAPGDAVLTATGMSGSFTLERDGSFSATSKITADLTTLVSDERRRDAFIKDETLETRRFPTAEFVPTKVTGLTLPLPAGGEMTFTLSGRMTIHGTTKDVSFSVKATRSGALLTATATADPAFRFADFGLRKPLVASVLSIEDDIRLEVSLVVNEGGR